MFRGILGIDPLQRVASSFAVHKDRKSHTGGTITSLKQKLVTRSSTEAEIVAVHDVLSQLLWTGQSLIMEQGFSLNESLQNRDSASTILIEKNGRPTSAQSVHDT
jgi:hypothetical protein